MISRHHPVIPHFKKSFKNPCCLNLIFVFSMELVCAKGGRISIRAAFFRFLLLPVPSPAPPPFVPSPASPLFVPSPASSLFLPSPAPSLFVPSPAPPLFLPSPASPLFVPSPVPLIAFRSLLQGSPRSSDPLSAMLFSSFTAAGTAGGRTAPGSGSTGPGRHSLPL